MKTAIACSLALLALGAAAAPKPAAAAPKPKAPTRAEVAAALQDAARVHRIPTVLLEGIAWHESRWRQWDDKGAPLSSEEGHIGLLGVPTRGRRDLDRLGSDWRYNVEEGAKALVLAWNRAPRIGVTGRLDDWRNVLESWYLALARYGRQGKDLPISDAYADSVLDAVASGGDGLWDPVTVGRPKLEDLQASVNQLCPAAPWHFGDVPPRPDAKPVVSLDVPYLNQVYDDPPGFTRGSGACGPTSMTMVLAYYGKFAPKPFAAAGWYYQDSLYGAYLPEVYGKVCDPGVGAVHAKMLDYLRQYFPGVAIFYHEKATPELVKAELDAGRPCILGTAVTNAGHIMVAKGYLADGRFLIGDPAGDREQAARDPKGGPLGTWSKSGTRYWNGDGGKAVYDWEALDVRWVITLGDVPPPTVVAAKNR